MLMTNRDIDLNNLITENKELKKQNQILENESKKLMGEINQLLNSNFSSTINNSSDKTKQQESNTSNTSNTNNSNYSRSTLVLSKLATSNEFKDNFKDNKENDIRLNKYLSEINSDLTKESNTDDNISTINNISISTIKHVCTNQTESDDYDFNFDGL